MNGSRATWSDPRPSFGATVVAVLFAAAVVACWSGGTGPDLHVENGTTLGVTLVVNGSVVGEIQASSSGTIPGRALPELPWSVVARSPSGRVLMSFRVQPGQVWATDFPDGHSESSGAGGRADLSCGRLDIWAGMPMAGPAPGPGVPGDCLP